MNLSEKLRFKKETIFLDLSNLFDYFKDTRNKQFCNLKAKYQRLESLASSFDDVVSEIFDYNAGAETKDKISLKDRDTFLELIDAIRSYYYRAEKAEQESNLIEATDSHGKSAPSLPNIQLPQFDGAIENWVEFKTLFDTLVHNNPQISEETKFHYLKTNLKGEAAATISSFALEKGNYQSAYQTLLNRYQSPRRLGNFYLQTILKYKSNGLNPQKFISVHESAISALKALSLPDLTEFLLFQLCYNNVDPATQQAFDIHLGRNDIIPTATDLLNYIRLLAKTEELKRDINTKQPLCRQNPRSHVSAVNERKEKKNHDSKLRCSYCKQTHFLAYCPTFKTKSWQEKREFIVRTNLCSNCLGAHHVRDCWSKKTCRVCQKPHHSLLHPTSETDSVSPSQEKIATHLSCRNRSVLLSTATIVILVDQTQYSVRALIDQGSQASFVSESLVQRLRLRRAPSFTVVSGIGATTSSNTRGVVHLKFKSRHQSERCFNTDALILPKLTDYLPPRIEGFPPSEAQQLDLADEDVSSRQPIEVILGADIYASILEEGIVRTSKDSVLLQNTSLGWIMCGAVTNGKGQRLSIHCSTVNKQLLQNLEKFWELEESKPSSHPEELQCEEHFQKTYRRTKDGRFVVRLPFKEEPCNLGESRNAASRALAICEKKLSKNQEFGNQYQDFLREYHNLGHMEEVTDIPTCHYFLPHHGIARTSSSTTKLRVVFNASKKTSSGKSLNDILHIGPQLLPHVQDLILRWRKYKIVFFADIKKMYRQILVHDDDRFFQLILWKNKTYSLKTVTYGTACAPYLAIRVLRQLAEEEDLPLGKEILNNEVYMDDILSGANDEDEALAKQAQLIELLRRGGFSLHKWATNSFKLLNQVPEELRASAIETNCFPTETHSMLGIKWQRDADVFAITTNLGNLPSSITKRSVLSSIARLFDPLGYAAPILIKAKIFLQSLWLSKLSWDDPLPETLERHWKTIYQDLKSIQLKLPRWIHLSAETESIEIHGFSDASEKGMAAVLYIKTRTNGIEIVSLLGSKTKVAPIKQISLPRLELTAAVLLTRLLRKIITALALPKINRICLWTDSIVTLYWIRNEPIKWTTFVANRVSEIQTSAPEARWSHVPSAENPADCATRGLTSRELNESILWWEGPHWLKGGPDGWPQQPMLIDTEPKEERRKGKLLSCHTSILSDCMDKLSNYQRVLRVTAYCLRYINKLRKISQECGPLSVSEILQSKEKLIKEVQKTAFEEEIKILLAKKSVPRSSRLNKLNPWLDDNGVLRVGGRLKHSVLHHRQKHPIILPPQHSFTTLIIREAHLRTLHGGTQLTLSTVRQEYWILRGRQSVKSVIKNCTACRRFQGSLLYQQMGNLPPQRVQPSRPFLHSGVDYAGPLYLRATKGRGHKGYKGYIAVFVCFFTRAVHLEAVSDYTAEGFLAAYRRFTSRRGICASISSDRGTNFVGAAASLASLFDPQSDSGQRIANHLSQEQTVWKFNPPAAPHFGGLWEAAVKSVKKHLRRVVGESKLTFEELSTLLCQIEAILNSRPLQPLSDDPDDLEPLTPAHFLIGQTLTTLPDTEAEIRSTSLSSRWRLLQAQRQSFWKTWSAEYLQQLQRRNKWESPTRQMAVGDLVLIQQEKTNPCRWPLARVMQLHPGSDGLVRVVTLKTAKAEAIQRPIVKLCLLLPSNQHQAAAASFNPSNE